MDATIFNRMSENMAAGVVAGGILGIGIGMIALIACIWYVFQVIAYWKIFGKFGEPGWGFAFGLMFLGPVFMLILGFGSSEYIGNTTA